MKSFLLLLFGLLLSGSLWAEGPAGIVLYYQSGEETFLLLGEDREEQRGWSAFGGGANKGESVKETAARETSEETRGYFEKAWLLGELAEKMPVKSKGYNMFFVEVPFVPAVRVARNELANESNGALREMSRYAWVPVSDLETVLAGKRESIDERFLPEASKRANYWKIWLKNMRDAYEQLACPWLEKEQQSE